MKLSTLIGLTALVLATGHAFGQAGTLPPAVAQTEQGKVEQREMLRRAAVTEQQKRRDDFARRCINRVLSDTELEACRAAYRQL